MSFVFQWKIEDLNNQIASCEFCQETSYVLKYMPKNGKILEAGCGSGRYVIYLSRKGFDITGIELGNEIVQAVNRIIPEADIRQGDILHIPFDDNSLHGIISLGVIEHFTEGPHEALQEMYRVLKPNHYAIITVPSFNYIRRTKWLLGIPPLNSQFISWASFAAKKMRRKKMRYSNLPYKEKKQVIPEIFFEYYFTQQEFEKELKRAGFEIVESIPWKKLDGIHFELGSSFVKYDGVKFTPNLFGAALNFILSAIPFTHNHMHLCVVKKRS